MSKKQSKNLQRVQDMVDGNFQTKTMVGFSEKAEPTRKVGDNFTIFSIV